MFTVTIMCGGFECGPVGVSWRHWPQRVFATAAELPRLQRRLIALATTMLALAGTAFALGVLATHL